MNLFEKARELARQAAEAAKDHEGLVERIEDMLPEDRKEQARGFVEQAEGALQSVAGGEKPDEEEAAEPRVPDDD